MWGLRRRHVAAAARLGLFFRVGGAPPRSPNPGLPARRALAAPCSRATTAQPPRQGERGGAGSEGSLGRRRGRGAGLAPTIQAPAEEETCQGEGGGVGRDLGPGSFLVSCWGDRERSGRVDSGTGPLQRAWNEAAAVQVQVLELCRAAGVVRGHFGPHGGRKAGGHRGLSIGGAYREVAAETPRNCA